MIKKIFFYLFLLLLFNQLQAQQNYIGNWQGSLNLGIDLRIVLHIYQNQENQFSATLDSPDQNAYNIPADTLYFNSQNITIHFKKINASYQGEINNQTNMKGVFSQAGKSFPLNLQKVDKVVGRARPQTPQPPFPYYIYNVEYDNNDKSIHYGATITIPKPDSGIAYFKAPQWPVALLITGSGQQDRDETILGHKPFWIIADYLSRHGYAVLRVDDRGVGKTTGEVYNATSADFANDVEVSLNFLKQRKDIDTFHMGLIGHSEGGMIAPIVASRRNDINFIILLAGPGEKITNLMSQQNAAVLKTAGITNETIKAFMPLYESISQIAIQTNDSVARLKKMLLQVKKWVLTHPQKMSVELNIANDANQKGYVQQMASVISTPWFKYFLSFDPLPYLKKLTCKVLAFNGEKDIQVLAEPNLTGMKQALSQSKAIYTIKEMPGLNHLFQHCQTCSLNEYISIEETFSPEVLKIMGDWLKKNVQ